MGAARFRNIGGVFIAMKQVEMNQSDKILAGEYALGLLSDEEKAVFEARLKTELALQRLYSNWIEDFVSLTDDIGEVDPPPGLYTGLQSRLFGTEAVGPSITIAGTMIRFIFGGLVAFIACVVIALLI